MSQSYLHDDNEDNTRNLNDDLMAHLFCLFIDELLRWGLFRVFEIAEKFSFW